MIDLLKTYVSDKAIKSVNRVLKTSWLSESKLVAKFENQLNVKLNLPYPLALNSGTSALHLALVVAGVEQNDEVILPAQTFVATGLVILMQRAVPVFADIQYETGNIDPKSIEAKITKKTKAIMPVHWAGYPCDMDEINAIAKKYKLAVIEDAAHALGAVYKDKPIGSVSRFTAFSFQATKHLTTADGGALSFLQKEDFEQARTRRWFGIDRSNSKPSFLGERIYDIQKLGYKYHMNDFSASLGLANLSDFKNNLKKRKKIASIYNKELKNVPGLNLLSYKDDRSCAYWIFTFLVQRRDDFIKKMLSKKISASVLHLRIDRNSVFGGVKEDLVNQAKFDLNQVSIPVHQGLTEKQISYIVKTIKSGW